MLENCRGFGLCISMAITNFISSKITGIYKKSQYSLALACSSTLSQEYEKRIAQWCGSHHCGLLEVSDVCCHTPMGRGVVSMIRTWCRCIYCILQQWKYGNI